MQDGSGTANTALAFHNKQLLALVESDLPYAVRALSLGSSCLPNLHERLFLECPTQGTAWPHTYSCLEGLFGRLACQRQSPTSSSCLSGMPGDCMLKW